MSKNTQKKQTAVQFLRKMDSMVNIMEGIAHKTRETEDALLEDMGQGIFDMSTMLDVKVPDEEDQPMLSINKPRELTDGDKAQIVEELANVLKRMPGEVIDFSDIGPIGTVIQTKLGFAQTLDGFLKDLISGAADSQNSQSFAKGTPVAGVQDVDQATQTAPIDDKAPTDIAPAKETIVDAPNATPVVDPMVPDVGMGDPMGATGLETPMDASLPSSDLDIGLDSGLDASGDIGDQVTDALGDVGMDTPAVDPIVDDTTIDSDIVPDSDPIAGDTGIGDDSVGDVDDTLDIPTDDTAATTGDNAGDTFTDDDAEPKEPTTDLDDDDDDDDLELDDTDVKLESIRNDFFAAERQRKVDAIMESVIAKVDEANEVAKTKDVTVALESIIAGVKKQKQLQAQLESIATTAKAKAGVVELPKKNVKPMATKKAPVNEAKAEKLSALIESFKQTQVEKKAKLEAIESRKKARQILESITK